MKIPYVIDNQSHTLAEVLNELLAAHAGSSLDTASTFFSAFDHFARFAHIAGPRKVFQHL